MRYRGRREVHSHLSASNHAMQRSTLAVGTAGVVSRGYWQNCGHAWGRLLWCGDVRAMRGSYRATSTWSVFGR